MFFYHRGLHPFLWGSSALPMRLRDQDELTTSSRAGLCHLFHPPPVSYFKAYLRQAAAEGRCVRARATTRASSQMNAVSSRAMATTTLL